jgi:hypothetical protein
MVALGPSSGFRICFGPQLEVARISQRTDFVNQNIATFAGALQAKIIESPEEWILWRHL